MQDAWWKFAEIDNGDIDPIKTGARHQADVNLTTLGVIHCELSANVRSIKRSIDR